MFPLYEETLIILFLLALGGVTAVFAGLRGRVSASMVIGLFVLAVVWPWPIAAGLGLNHYTIRAALFFSFWTTTAVGAGILWGLIARRLRWRAAALMLALLPSVASAAYVLERQRIPAAACAEHATFAIGDLTVRIPRQMGASAQVSDGAPAQPWSGAYSAWTGAKADVRAFCAASRGGREPLPVSHLRFSYNDYRRSFLDCEADTPSAICSAAGRIQLPVVQLYALADRLPGTSMGHFNQQQVTAAITAGAREGTFCKPGTGAVEMYYCSVWMPLSPEVLMVATAKLSTEPVSEDVIADAAILLDHTIETLGVE